MSKEGVVGVAEYVREKASCGVPIGFRLSSLRVHVTTQALLPGVAAAHPPHNMEGCLHGYNSGPSTAGDARR